MSVGREITFFLCLLETRSDQLLLAGCVPVFVCMRTCTCIPTRITCKLGMQLSHTLFHQVFIGSAD
jgi:hypothetical protein